VVHSCRLPPYPQTYARLDRLARFKHSSLLRKFVNYGQKSFITLAPGLPPRSDSEGLFDFLGKTASSLLLDLEDWVSGVIPDGNISIISFLQQSKEGCVCVCVCLCVCMGGCICVCLCGCVWVAVFVCVCVCVCVRMSVRE
jgi:hypothetical protein